MKDVSALETEHTRLSQYLTDNAVTGAGTLEYRKAVLTHRTLADFVRRGEPDADRSEVARQLEQIDFGTHPLLVPASKLWRHKKRGTTYEIVTDTAFIQCTSEPQFERMFEDENWTVYRNVATGATWVRPTEEFLDGRFEPLDR